MSLETGTYINSLVSTNPLGSDERSRGDDHIRLLKATIKASFPDVDEVVATVHSGSSAPVNKQAGTVWRDTSNNLWKFYSGSGWVTLPFSTTVSNSVDINAGSIDAVTLGTNSAVTEAQIDNINVNGNAITSTDTDGDLTITPNGTGEIILDGQKWPQADGSSTNYLTTNGAGQIAWTTNTVPTSETNASNSATTATAQAVIATAKAVLTAADVVSTSSAVVSCNAVLDTFDDRFLGSKGSVPTVDNDGATLTDGALYFLTTTNRMFVYDLATTTWLQLAPSDADQANIDVVAGNILYQEDLGSITDSVTSGSGSDISTVAGSIANINLCGNDIANINAVASDATDIGVVAGKATEIGLLGTSAAVADLALVGVSSVITDLDLIGASGVIGNIATVATNASNVNAVGGISANVTTVAGISANVTTVAGVSANVSTVAGSISDINRYAQEYIISSSTPTSPTPAEGDLWYDSTNNVLKYHNGTGFISIASGIADVVSDGSPQLGAALDCQNNNINNCGTVDGSNLQMDFGSIA